MKNLLLILTISFSLSLFSQEVDKDFDTMQDKFNDAFAEDEDNLMTLRFFDAKTGLAIENANIIIKDESYKTDPEGKVRFPMINKDGIYFAKFSYSGYITASYKFEVVAGTIFFNRFSASPKLDIGSVRIVLDWSRKPLDLDANLEKKGSYIISYRNKRTSSDGSAILDRDDRDGYGPETITINNVNEQSNYNYYVIDYSNKSNPSSKKLSKSKASVKIYANNSLLKTIQVNPQKTKGNKWNVFSILNGEFVFNNNVGR